MNCFAAAAAIAKTNPRKGAESRGEMRGEGSIRMEMLFAGRNPISRDVALLGGPALGLRT